MAKTVTFYSFKGGTGRSVGLANAAYLIAKMGKNVACVDLDVEAAGLIKIFDIQPPEKNVIDILIDPRTRIGDASVLYNDQAPELEGMLYIIPALIKQDSEKLTRLKWVKTAAAEFVDKLYDFGVEYNIDYFFVDTRSGTGSNAFFMNLQSDAIVMYSRIDGQGREGTKHLLSSFQDGGSTTPFIVVCSSIPNHPDAMDLLAKFAIEIGKDIDIQLPYNHALAVKEQVVFRATRIEEFQNVISRYDKLAQKIIDTVENDD